MCCCLHRLRDELLDAARERVEVLGMDAVAEESLGHALEAVLQQRLKKQAAPVADAPVGDGDVADGQMAAAAAPGDAAGAGTNAAQAPDAPAAGALATGAAEAASAGPEAAQAGASSMDVDVKPQDPAQQPGGTALEDRVAAKGGSAAPHAASTAAQSTGTADAAATTTAAQAASSADAAAAAGGAAPSATQPLQHVTPDMLHVLDWHWANLEYGCSARLAEVSLAHWNQDEEWGGFGGPHCMVVGGFGQLMAGLAGQLDVRTSTAVAEIDYSQEDGPVKVRTAAGEVLEASGVIVTLPLGVLKAGDVAFVPGLPAWKTDAIQRLGFGDLNKVVMQVGSVDEGGSTLCFNMDFNRCM